MTRLDHLGINVRNAARSRDWYVSVLKLKVEFEVPHMKTIALQDEGGFTLFVSEPTGKFVPSCVLTFQVDDIEAEYRELSARGIIFENPPMKLAWGYGAELRDPDGYLVCLWDEKTMREKG